MNSSFYNGVSGMKTQQFGIDVWANNISNVNTYGFRSSTPEFSSIFSTTLTTAYYGAAMSDIGYGARAQTTALDLTQGSFENTDNPFDLALGGEGWFGVQGVGGENYYTRAGNFYFDADGNLVDQNGYKLLGTLGNNIAPAQIDASKLIDYGYVYGVDERTLVDGYEISKIDTISLAPPSEQTTITLPSSLYMPAVPTQNISFQANLDPETEVEIIDIDLDPLDYVSTITPSGSPSVTFPSSTLNYDGTVTIEGSITNTSGILNPQENDAILITITDANGQSIQRTASLNSDLQTWSLENAQIDDLDTSGELTISVALRTEQEIPNEERFTYTVIAPNGDKDLLDLRFTQQLPKSGDTTSWDIDAKILKYYEPYEILQYDPTQSYDPNLYTIENGQVVKNYDPNEYYIDTTSKKVYSIVDAQVGEITFAGNGALLDYTLGALDNSGYALNLDLGESLETQSVTNFSQSIQDDTIYISGSGLTHGDNLEVTITDNGGNIITVPVLVKEGGTWSLEYDVSSFDQANTTVEVTHIINSGWEGLVSNTALEKDTIITDKDGAAEGLLTGYSVDETGQILAQFTNSQTIPVAKIAIFQFQNDQGLSSLDGSIFQATANSGEPIFYTDENGNYIQTTKILSNSLEVSNVNLATALTELIVMQKAFSSNAKTITTSDEMIQNAIEMKQ